MFRCASSAFTVLIRSAKLPLVYRVFVSSANNINIKISEHLHRSLIYNMNNRGPRIDPWGTPHVIDLIVDTKVFTLVNCSLLVR